MEPIYEHDENGNLIYSRTSDDYESWWEYDERGKMIHYRTSDDYESWWEYDERGKMIHYRNSDGYVWNAAHVLGSVSRCITLRYNQ